MAANGGNGRGWQRQTLRRWHRQALALAQAQVQAAARHGGQSRQVLGQRVAEAVVEAVAAEGLRR